MDIEIIRSARKTVSVEIRQDLKIVVRAPFKMRSADITEFVNQRRSWIEKNLELMAIRRAEAELRGPTVGFTATEIKLLSERTREIVCTRTAELARVMGMSYNRISVRSQVSRWGSCSSLGNLNFNCLLALCPARVVDYIIIHELCHLRHMDHSKAFWNEVARYCPDYKSCKQWLKADGGALIARLRESK